MPLLYVRVLNICTYIMKCRSNRVLCSCLKRQQVNVEKNELQEENSTLETQIRELKSEIGTRLSQSKPDLNEPPPLPSQFHGDHPGLPAVEPVPQQPSALLVVPIHPDIQTYPTPDPGTQQQPAPKTNCVVSKPHARYPTPADSWPSQLLGKQ
ncbi:hypothetical protein PVK06_037381 [Gossypium arboreum]|uniref:Uncharacterized protein n=1 Tax=Gossypium arboreum TaxID=29729 RepID=A0ABR0MX67_GOSAR|nr:hypothetical protein PVK06_037381 [Gossypium arboreum]